MFSSRDGTFGEITRETEHLQERDINCAGSDSHSKFSKGIGKTTPSWDLWFLGSLNQPQRVLSPELNYYYIQELQKPCFKLGRACHQYVLELKPLDIIVSITSKIKRYSRLETFIICLDEGDIDFDRIHSIFSVTVRFTGQALGLVKIHWTKREGPLTT